MRVIIAGGGTGGHVIPALAIAQELRSRYRADVMFVGTPRGIEKRLVPAAGFELQLIEVGALNRVEPGNTVEDHAGSAARDDGFVQAHPRVSAGCDDWRRRLRLRSGDADGRDSARPDDCLRAERCSRLRQSPGRADRESGGSAVRNKLASYFRNCQVTGVPVRREFFNVPPRPTDAQPTLLVFGGSQGAHAINQAVLDALPQLAEAVPGLCIIHQTGEKDYVDAQAIYLKHMVAAEVSPFIDDMPGAFARADLVLCRSGASTVAEITAAGKPAIFVPLPTAADDHQRHNAEILASGKRSATAAAIRALRRTTGSRDRLAYV